MARLGWIPRALGAAALVTLTGSMVGCDNQDASIPSTPPLAATEPAQIFLHLKYLVVRKDYKHVVLIAPIAPDIVFPSAWWFHKHSADLKIELTDEELNALGVMNLKGKLDNLPRADEKDYGVEQARLAFNAGLYRVLKGIPDDGWRKMVVSETKINPGNTRVTDLFLAYGGKQILKIGCLKKPDGNYGVSFVQYLAVPSAIFPPAKPKAKG